MFNASTFSQKINPFSQEFWNRMGELASVVAMMQAEQSNVSQSIGRIMRTQDTMDFPAKITGAQPVDGLPMWLYSWEEVEPANSIGTNTDYQTKSGGRTGSQNAINLLELGNTSSLAYGYAVSFNSGWKLTADGFTNFQFDKVPNNVVVRMRVAYRAVSSTQRYEFSAPNRIDGTC